MGFEERKGRSYYYHKRRAGGRVISEYVGRGLFGELSAARYEVQRGETARRRAAEQRWRRECDDLERQVNELGRLTSALQRVVLAAGGYHAHKGQWRQRRGITRGLAAMGNKGKNTQNMMLDLEQRPDETEGAWLSRIVGVIQDYTNDTNPPTAIVEFARGALDAHPRVWRLLGDMSVQVRRKLINIHASGPILRDTLDKGHRQMRDDLGYQDAPLLERMLIDQIVLCWLQLHIAEWLYAANMEANNTRAAEFCDRRVERTQRRYLRAIETLAKIRKLGPKTVMFNVAHQQVNAAIG